MSRLSRWAEIATIVAIPVGIIVAYWQIQASRDSKNEPRDPPVQIDPAPPTNQPQPTPPPPPTGPTVSPGQQALQSAVEPLLGRWAGSLTCDGRRFEVQGIVDFEAPTLVRFDLTYVNLPPEIVERRYVSLRLVDNLFDLRREAVLRTSGSWELAIGLPVVVLTIDLAQARDRLGGRVLDHQDRDRVCGTWSMTRPARQAQERGQTTITFNRRPSQ